MKSIKKIVYSVSILSGTIIGAGVFSLPYITKISGWWTMLLYFLVLGALVTVIHLFFAELTIKTDDFKRLPGFARVYLGKKGEWIALFSGILSLFGIILAYLILGGEFLTDFLSPLFGGSKIIYTLLYFSLGAVLIFYGIKIISKIEFWGLILFFLVIIFIFFKAIPLIRIDNLFLKTGTIKDIFLPYGPILFSLWGVALIPETEEMLAKEKFLLKKIIPIAIIIPIIVYLFFIFLILGISGSQTTPSALTGLRVFLDDRIASLVFFFGVLTTFTSFIAAGLTLKKVFWYDLKINKNIAWLITCFLPLIVFLAGVNQFITVISLVGGIMMGINGILILLMYKKIKPKSIFVYPLILIFFGGIIYEIIYFLR